MPATTTSSTYVPRPVSSRASSLRCTRLPMKRMAEAVGTSFMRVVQPGDPPRAKYPDIPCNGTNARKARPAFPQHRDEVRFDPVLPESSETLVCKIRIEERTLL